MHVGYAPMFQNPGNALPDAEVYRQELRLAEMAEPLGFDSLWSVEHHFTDYTMCPDVLQFLTYMAGKTQHVKLGSMVVVLPWHDPMRVAEQIAMLDHLSGGRVILGLGRGLARVEYEGFRIDQNAGRQRFVEYAQLVLNGLEKGYIEGGETVQQPRRDIRPSPLKSFRERTYAAAVSPESMPIMAQLGVGLLVIQLHSQRVDTAAAGYMTIIGAGILVGFFAAFLLVTSHWSGLRTQDAWDEKDG